MATRIASLCISNLKTTAKWMDHFVVECYSDAAYTQLINTQTSSAIWDGTFNNQHDPIIVSGLTYGSTYYLRAGVVSPITGSISWTTASIQAGSNTAPAPGYNINANGTFGGTHFQITPASAPTDIDHFEATWNGSGSFPLTTDAAKWKGDLTTGQPYFEFTVPGPNNNSFYLFVRSVNTTHQPQDWQSLGLYYGGQVDPTDPAVLPRGNMTPTVSGAMTYLSNATIIAWYWDGIHGGSSILTLYRMDGTTESIPGSAVGTASLTPSTIYYFYPYFKEARAGGPGVGFSAGGIGTNDSVTNSSGGANLAYTSRTLQAAANCSRQGYVALSPGGMAAQTQASGSVTGTAGGSGGYNGGGGGGGGGCPRRGMLVRTRYRGLQPVEAIEIGDEILGRGMKWQKVTKHMAVKEGTFIRIRLSNGEWIDQSPETPMPLARGQKLTKDLSLGDILHVLNGTEEQYAQIRSLSVVDALDFKYAITCEPDHEFYCGAESASLLTHNILFYK